MITDVLRADLDKPLHIYTMLACCSLLLQVMETQFKEDMSEAEAVDMIKECILAGIFNDLGSGSNCDITVIRNTGEVRYSFNSFTFNSYTYCTKFEEQIIL